MKTIVLLGAGKSSHVLIDYLARRAAANDWKLRVGDIDLPTTLAKIARMSNTSAFSFDIMHIQSLSTPISEADIVISMVPAAHHITVAKLCIEYKKHLITPSYISEEMQALNEEAKANNLIFLNEMGLDPGIDHMSAMKIIDELHERKCTITSFKSYCGGLIAPESDNNPWNYKFTWNPRNVVVAGQGKGGIKYIDRGQLKYLPYFNLFKHIEKIKVDHWGVFEGYPNRNSLQYKLVYGLNQIPTLLRGTLRKNGFCSAWDVLIQLGLTEDSYELDLNTNHSRADFFNCFLKENGEKEMREKIQKTLGYEISNDTYQKIEWLGLFDPRIQLTKTGTPAQILQSILEEKWVLEKEDKDMVVMIHQFEYLENGVSKKLESSLVVKGKNQLDTAMAMTVGLPIGIACVMILNNQIKTCGVMLPITSNFYIPILTELESFGIKFEEKTSS